MNSSKIKRPVKSYRAYFTTLFLAFGAIIALLTSVVNYNLEVKNVNTELNNRAEIEFLSKRKELADYTKSLEDYVVSLRNSRLLQEYVRDPSPERYEDVSSLFYAVARTNHAFMQVRFIDKFGKENIRIDWHSGEQEPLLIERHQLQDKSHRYYYLEASQTRPNTFWYSKLDLNIESNKIEVPYKPVLRIASPVYVDQEYAGVVIINAHAKGLLNRFRQSTFFSISIIDGDGDFLVHHDDSLSWSKYLQTGYSIEHDQPELADRIMLNATNTKVTRIGDVYVASVKDVLSQDQAAIMFHPEENALATLLSQHRNATVVIIGMIFLLSIPVAFFLSKIPASLNQKVAEQTRVLEEYVSLIDENIMTSTADEEGNIVDVSSAYANTCGYNKSELIGKSFSLLRDENVPIETYDGVWEVLNKGKIWKGELQHKSKLGQTYWTSLTITPNRSDDGELTTFTAIHQNITDRKNVEQLAITDELTGLYNRRYFNTIISRELQRAQRSGKTLTFAMMDLDHFKQYNDHYGHQKGDVVLTTIGNTLKKVLNRGSDYSFRLGGEEFGVIFTDLLPAEGIVFADKISLSIENLGIEHQWSEVASVVTISMGLLSVTPGPGITVDEIYKEADEALYKAKEIGRNQIVPRILDAKV